MFQGLVAARGSYGRILDSLEGQRYFGKGANREDRSDHGEQVRVQVRDSAALLTSHSYYDLVTDFFEYGWSQSFHFCRFQPQESFVSALARHEFYLASMLNIRPGARLLDAGCGVGGPARQIASFTGANVTGITINSYQVQRARRLTIQAGLDDQVDFLQANFLVRMLIHQ